MAGAMKRWKMPSVVAVAALCLGLVIGLAVGRSGAAGAERERARKSGARAEAMTRKSFTLTPAEGMVFYHDGESHAEQLTIDLFGSGGSNWERFESAGFSRLGLADVTHVRPSGGWSKPAEVVRNLLDQIRAQDPAWRDVNFWQPSAQAWDPNTHAPLDTGSVGVICHDYGFITIVACPSASEPNLVTVFASTRVTDRLPRRMDNGGRFADENE